MSEAEIIGLSFAGAGAVPFLLGVIFCVRTLRFLARALDTAGTVVDLKVSRGSSGGSVYKPVVEFSTAAGAPVRFTDTLANSKSVTLQVGASAPIKYDPRRPQRAKIATPFRLWFVSGLLGGIGATFVLPGVLILLLGA